MKKWYILTALLLSLLCTILVGIRNEYTIKTIQNEIAGEVLRFHVRANSDTEEDQKIKMQIKETVVTYLNPLLNEIRNVETAKLLVENHLPEVEKIIHEQLNDIGCSYGFQIKITKEYFPRKTYGDCTFPEGNYEAVVISLGKGEGQNWWCMLYPGLCFLDETYAIVPNETAEMEAVVSEELEAAVPKKTDEPTVAVPEELQVILPKETDEPTVAVPEESQATVPKEIDELKIVVPDEKKQELAEALTEDAYEWITDSEHIKVKFRIQWLNKLFHIE